MQISTRKTTERLFDISSDGKGVSQSAICRFIEATKVNCAAQLGRSLSPIVVICSEAWALFEAGDMDAYAMSIAESIKSRIAEGNDVDSIVLAQASMRVAEIELVDTGIPVHSSPVIAAHRCLEIAHMTTKSTS